MKQIKKLAEQLGAEIEVWADSENSYVIEATAPDGMEWVESGGVSLVSRYWTYAKESKKEAEQDILTRMKQGLQTEN